jgi:hypothetical protein
MPRQVHSLYYYTLDDKINIFSSLLSKVFSENKTLKQSIEECIEDGTFNFYEEQDPNKIKSQFYYIVQSFNNYLLQNNQPELNLKDKGEKNQERIKEAIKKMKENAKIILGDTVRKNVWGDNEEKRNEEIYEELKACKDDYARETKVKELSQKYSINNTNVKVVYNYMKKKKNERTVSYFKDIVSILDKMSLEELQKIQTITEILKNLKLSELNVETSVDKFSSVLDRLDILEQMDKLLGKYGNEFFEQIEEPTKPIDAAEDDLKDVYHLISYDKKKNASDKK